LEHAETEKTTKVKEVIEPKKKKGKTSKSIIAKKHSKEQR
jgi:hypothetical protein